MDYLEQYEVDEAEKERLRRLRRRQMLTEQEMEHSESYFFDAAEV